MAEARTFYRPLVKVAAEGSRVESWSRLTVTSAAGFSLAVLVVPRPDEIDADSRVEIRLDPGNGPELIFTGTVSEMYPHHGKRRYILEPAPRRALRETVEPASWRKERSGNIAEEILQSTGNPFDADLSAWPDVELSRFSVPSCSRHWALQALEHAVREAAGITTGRVVGPDGVLYLGPLEEIRREVASPVALETGVNVILRAGDTFNTFAFPVGYNQVVSVDDEDRLCTNARLDIQPGRYRAGLVLEAI